MADLKTAMESFERRILSLNYNGYFTSTFFSEFQQAEALDLFMALRFPLWEGQGNKFHYYGVQSEVKQNFCEQWAAKWDKKKKEWQNDFKINESNIENYVSDIYKVYNKIIKDKNKVKLNHIAVDERYLDYKHEGKNIKSTIRTRITIPIFINMCPSCKVKFYYEIKDNYCRCKKDQNLILNLRGVICLFSELPKKVIRTRLARFSMDHMNFLEKLCNLFAGQEEPDCYKNPNGIPLKYCKRCRFNEECHVGFSLDIQSGHQRTDLLDPDEVIHQLQEKCRTIMGEGYHFPILLHDAGHRIVKPGPNPASAQILRYRAVNYLELVDKPRPFNILKKQAKYYNQIMNGAKLLDKRHESECLMVSVREDQNKPVPFNFSQQIKEIFNCKEKRELCKLTQKLIANIVQATDEGITDYVWNTWESKLELFNDTMNKIPEPNTWKDGMKNIRDFAEYLFFTGRKLEGLITTPLGYLGQKLGLLFTMVEKDKEEDHLSQEEKIKQDEVNFLRISREFAPLLFHSLEFEIYRRALGQLRHRSFLEVPDILLEVLPSMVNMVAGAFWSKEEYLKRQHPPGESEGSAPAALGLPPLLPQFFHAFNFSENKLCLTLQRIGRNSKGERDNATIREFLTTELGTVHRKVEEIFEDNERKPVVLSFSSPTEKSPQIYDGKLVNVNSRLLLPLPLGQTEAEALPEELHGVLDLYFDLSPFVLHRHALDLARELGFIFTQTAHAAAQKQAVMNHGIKAAVAAIMSRNMSHNIGSHILARLRINEILKQIYVGVKHHIDRLSLSDEEKQQGEKNFREFLGKKELSVCGLLLREFHEYLQQKSDFLAEVSTEPYRSPCTAFLYQNVIKPFSQNVLLLDYIARNENLNFFNININFLIKTDDGEVLQLSPTLLVCNLDDDDEHTKFFPTRLPFYKICPLCEVEDSIYQSKNVQNIERDVAVDLPGSVGEFALFNIMEAIIRNAAKHNVNKIEDGEKHQLDLNFLVEDSENPESLPSYTITIWDNLSDCNKKEKIQGMINTNIIDHITGELHKQNWGIAEMKICATLLQDKDFTTMERSPDKIIRAWSNDKYFGYQFEILKARRSFLLGSSTWEDFMEKINA